MNTLTRFALALLAAAILGCQSAPPAPTATSVPSIDALAATPALLPFATVEGLRRLASADSKRGFAALANQYEAQINGAFCGPTTAAIVLNAVHTRSPDLPRDRERLRDGDVKNLPPGADLIVPRHTHSIINRPSKPAWLKDLAVIDMGLYRRFYRQKRRSFAGAGDGAICGGATFSTSSSIRWKHTKRCNLDKAIRAAQSLASYHGLQ